MSEVVFNLKNAINLSKARSMMRGKGGGSPSLDTVRRWGNRRCGCRPVGVNGPVIYLNVIRVNGEMLTMPEWVEEFERRRADIAAKAVDHTIPTEASEALDRKLEEQGLLKRK